MVSDRTGLPLSLHPPATLGVIGGGQLGRMFAHAAQRAGYRVAVLDPDETSPAGTIAHEQVRTAYLDAAKHEPERFRIVDASKDVVARLRARGVMTDARGDRLRLGPAPYLTDDEIDRGVAAVVAELKGR